MILVCGEALVDLFVRKSASGSIATEAVLGGSPYNVAVALSRLGHKAGFCGGISRDIFGDLLAAELRLHDIDLSNLVRSERLSTISVVATDAQGNPTYSFHGEGKADRLVQAGDLPGALPDNVDAVAFGSYTIAVPPVCDTLLALARREAGLRTISLDPNVRPTVTPDMAAWRRRFEAFLACANLVKASDEDIAVAYGTSADMGELVARWHAVGPSLIVITHGARGATGYLRGCPPVSVPGRNVDVVDTVGAGDTFHAAMLACLSTLDLLRLRRFRAIRPAELETALRYAVVAASLTCTRAGAAAPTRDEVELALST